MKFKTLEQTDKTKNFINSVKLLIAEGEVKNREAIVEALHWDKTMLSNVMNGRKNIPNDIYKKFTEVYQPLHAVEDKIINNASDKDTVANLAETLRILAEAKLVSDRTALTLAESHRELTKKPEITKPEIEEILEVIHANQIGLLDGLALIASGTKFPSKEQALDVLSKKIYAMNPKVKSKGKQLASSRTDN